MKYDWTYSSIEDAAFVAYTINPAVRRVHRDVEAFMRWIRDHTETTKCAPGYWDTFGITVTVYDGDTLPLDTYGCKVTLSPYGVREYVRLGGKAA
jgi:N12 class adenine-specific DNA methylase